MQNIPSLSKKTHFAIEATWCLALATLGFHRRPDPSRRWAWVVGNSSVPI